MDLDQNLAQSLTWIDNSVFLYSNMTIRTDGYWNRYFLKVGSVQIDYSIFRSIGFPLLYSFQF